MDYDIYSNIQMTFAAIIMFMSIQMLTKTIPDALKNSPYHLSCRIMGCAFAILPTASAIYYFTNLENMDKNIATALNLSAYYPTAALINIAFLALIGEKINFKSRNFKLYFISFLLFPIYFAIGFKFRGTDRTLTIGNTLLFSSIVGQFFYFYTRYKHIELRKKGKYVHEIIMHVRWVRKSIKLLVGLAVIACLAPAFFTYNIWLGLFYSLFGLVAFVHIYEGYERFVIKYDASLLMPSLSNEHDAHIIKTLPTEIETPTLNQEQIAQLEKQINNWLNKKGFKKNGVTIETVSKEMGSNRTYLSIYINKVYHCTFKTWILQLRINEAKHLLLDKHHYTVTDIAQKCGFPSTTALIHAFRKAEGLPPAKWRNENKL